MEGNGFDPCECVWSHSLAMRRLLSFLRQSQTYCTDNECLLELPASNVDATDQSFYYMFVGCFLFAMVWFYLRPNPDPRREDALKVENNEDDSSDNSSDPPPLG